MDPISNVISVRAENLFKSPTIKEDPTIDLEAPLAEDDILFQEEVSINLPSSLPTGQASGRQTPETTAGKESNMAALTSMIKSMQNQLDAMLQLIDKDTK